MTIVHYLSHPQVEIDATLAIDRWPLNKIGHARVAALAASGALVGTTSVFSSAEVKALQTAKPLADMLSCTVQVRALMHENDRSATGYLPAAEFEAVADQFFSQPDESVRGWETARMAQARIVAQLQACLALHNEGNILIVGHGAVGTLLYCALAKVPIDRRYDQPIGGGNYLVFDSALRQPIRGWRPMERLYCALT